MTASAMPPFDWPQGPATPPTHDDHDFPPFQWWPPTPGTTGAEESFLAPPAMMSPPFSPFATFGSQTSMLAPSQFLQPFLEAAGLKNGQLQPPPRRHPHGQQQQNQQQPYPSPISTSPFGSASTSSVSPFASLSPFASAQPSPAMAQLFSPPPSNARSTPSPVSSARGSPQNSFRQPTGVLKRHSFLKLPPEVRAAIYQELVPEEDLHVTTDHQGGKMFSYHCQGMSDAEYVGRHWFTMNEPEYRKLGSTPRECGHLACVRYGPRSRGLGRDERGWVALAMTCKAIHDEFAPYMYARPRLMLDDDAVLLRFLETADGERLRHFVRKLSVAYLVPESPTVGSHKSPHAARLGDWIRSWQGIALMEGLKHLQVTVVARGAFANRSYEARVLGPLMLLRGRKKEDGKGGKLETFEVMSFEGTRECGLPAGLENAPFKYIWRAWMLLGGPELERVARRQKKFVDAQPPYWHHLSSYNTHAFYRGNFNMRSLYSVM